MAKINLTRLCIPAILMGLAGCASESKVKTTGARIVTNPIDINYQFQPEDNDPSRREAADPACEYFNGSYWLFASKSGGYWRSDNLAEWEYIPAPSIATVNEYAPTILPIGDTLYFTASSDGNPTRIFRTRTPQDGNSWEEIECKLSDLHQHDPSFYQDEDGRVYIYWGCHDVEPIYGMEIDPNDGFKPLGEPVVLIGHNTDKYGWEQPGVDNEEPRNGWNEGPAMLKVDGKYYLQYAGPGTQYRIYADGIYVGDSPLGPFTYMEDNPFSIKPGGFIGAAGHGHTFRDKYGNYWHVASMLVGVRHWFERRLGLFPVTVKDNDMRAYTTFADYPFIIPDKKVTEGDFNDRTLSTGWRQLAIGKSATASSEGTVGTTGSKTQVDTEGNADTKGYARYATDELIETWWTAETGNAGEWLQVDLGKDSEINAIQVNFADEGSTALIGDSLPYKYVIEVSYDGKKWRTFADMSDNTADNPHRLLVADTPVNGRYVRITNRADMPCKFSIMDLRVFGRDDRGQLADVTGFKAVRNESDRRVYDFEWDAVKDADGYILRWGTREGDPSHSVTVRDTKYHAGYFNRDSEYFFTIEAF